MTRTENVKYNLYLTFSAAIYFGKNIAFFSALY